MSISSLHDQRYHALAFPKRETYRSSHESLLNSLSSIASTLSCIQVQHVLCPAQNSNLFSGHTTETGFLSSIFIYDNRLFEPRPPLGLNPCGMWELGPPLGFFFSRSKGGTIMIPV